MRCPQCQHDAPSDAQFCPECGARLTVACPQCGASNAPGHKFCKACGSPLTGSPAAGTKFSSPAAFTPTHLAELILNSRSSLEGERKQVTILFADLKASTELVADRDPEEARRILDPVLERMIDAVHHYEGTVNQVMGDGIMAIFGAPLAHEDHAVRACYAALKMQTAVSQYAGEIQRTHGVPIQIRVGLNSGEVVVRSIGSDLHMDYSAVGQTTHLAARMEQTAMPGSILITPETLQLAEGYIEVISLGPVNVKGLSTPLEVYEVAGAGPARTRLQVAATRGLSGFVGRQTELDAMRQALERAGRGHGQMVSLIGEPGVGKSRLIWEFTRSHRTHGWLVLESGSFSYGKATAYLPVIDLLKAYFEIENRDDTRRIREKVTGKLMTLDNSLGPVIPAFLSLLSVPVDDPAWTTLDPPVRRQRTLEAIKRLLLGESQVQPLVLIFEDLHWIDAETQALLDSMVDSLPTARILLLVNYRPEYQHGWGNKSYYLQLRIDPLPPETADEFLSTLLGTDQTLASIKLLLIERTGGNPFFLEESVRTLVETGVLAGARGAYRQRQPVDRTQVPATIQAMLAARIDRLDPIDKRLLQSAAVIGKDIPFVLLQAIAESAESDLRRGLMALQAAEFLYESRLFPELEFTFKHALTLEVTYGSLLQETRRGLHSRIVDAIETHYLDRLDEHVERLAHHTMRGGIWDKAVKYAREAGAKATSGGAYQESVALFEQALAALQQLPQSPETIELGIDVRLDLRQVLFALGEFGRMLEHLRAAEAAAAALADPQRSSRLAGYLAQEFPAWGVVSLPFVMGDHQRAVESAQRSLAMAAATGDFAYQVMAHYALGEAFYWLGDYQQSAMSLRKVTAMLEGDLVHERFSRLGFAGLPSVFARGFLARCLAEQGEFVDGVQFGEEAVQIASAGSESVDLLAAYSGLGILYLRKGESGRAIELLERCINLEQTREHPYWFPMIAAPMGAAYLLAGDLDKALVLLEQAVERAAGSRLAGGHPLRLASLSEVYLRSGRIDDAQRVAREALDLTRKYRERGREAWTMWLHGEIASHRQPSELEPAESAYRAALMLADELHLRPLVAHCRLGLGILCRRSRRAGDCRAELTKAAELFGQMGMPVWKARAESELVTIQA